MQTALDNSNSLILSNDQVKAEYESLSRKFDESMKDLNLTTVIRTKAQIEGDSKALTADLSEIKSYLNNISDGISGVDNRLAEFIVEFRETVNSHDVKPDLLEASKIDANEVKDVSNDYNPSIGVIRSGSSIQFKMWMYQNAADKDFGIVTGPMREEIEKEVAILKQLERCTYIIRFFGTYISAGHVHLLMEYAAHGNLEDYMKTNTLDWKMRLNIAVDISRGLSFLHEVSVLHHDLRSANIMLTDTNQAKIANFRSSRKDADISRAITEDMLRLRWTAPEKLRDPKEPYTKRCDVYSFAMVLWHISSGNIPLSRYEDFEAYNKAVQGVRDEVVSGTPEGYADIMIRAWSPEPKSRPTISDMFMALKTTADRYTLPKPSITHSNTGFIYPNPNTPPAQDPHVEDMNDLRIVDDSDLLSDDELDIRVTAQVVVPIEQGLAAHKARNYHEAWNCFNQNARIGNADGNYWVGYYISKGLAGQTKNVAEGVRYWQIAADAGHVDAQFRYGASLMTGEGVARRDSQKGFEYLSKAAEAGNVAARFNVGDILFTGSVIGIPKDDVRAIMTTAARPTFDPARGKDNKGPTLQYSNRDLAAHTKLKFRQPGQGISDEIGDRERLKDELRKAEREHFEQVSKEKGEYVPRSALKEGEEDEDMEPALKRRRLMEEATKAAWLDKDDSDDDDEESDSVHCTSLNILAYPPSSSMSSDEDDDGDDTAELLRELAKIKQERAEEKERQEREKQAEEDAKRAQDILTGNPLLNLGDGAKMNFNVKRRWDEDVIFKNQARGVDERPKKRFVNDTLRSDFHKRFLGKFIK
ncbi:Cwf15/Cwc15 cell cycle control protein-domain-containing protein [Jimgerdemannia flammicorona]|uniref:Cwf15/Cwc15 cell cycle control protein-domain-containing protein n=1 Tax=Jimgerdemannia flammicorona TaxID=994334 RepID=A0A433D4B5_9FUNG|nr:Cwf15/Cwc15 cell cycle control protein-domain-containing protein [Jimgerdemannia flammicorona]